MHRATADPFWRSVGVVLAGTVGAQSIPIIGSLVLARLYIPSQFGIFSAWLGLTALAAVMITGRFEMALPIEPDGANGLRVRSAAQCQHVRAVSAGRVGTALGNVGPIVLHQVREALALIFDLPA